MTNGVISFLYYGVSLILLSLSYVRGWTPNQNYTIYATGIFIGAGIYNSIFIWKYLFSNPHKNNQSVLGRFLYFIWLSVFFSCFYFIFYFGVGMDFVADMPFDTYIIALPEWIAENKEFIALLAVVYLISVPVKEWKFNKSDRVWGGMGLLILGLMKGAVGSVLVYEGYPEWMPFVCFFPFSMLMWPFLKKTTIALEKLDKKLSAEQKQKKYFVKAKRAKRKPKGIFFEKRSAPILYEGKRLDIDFSDMYHKDD